MGDFILSQIREDKLRKKGTIKVRCFPGAKFDNFYHCAIPLLNKRPDRIVLHMGTNNAPYCTREKMVDQILGLKNFILQKLPTCEYIISTSTLRTGNNTTANKRSNLFVNPLKKLNIKLILNDNIEKKTSELSRVAPAHVWCYKVIRKSSERYPKLMSTKFLSCFDN